MAKTSEKALAYLRVSGRGQIEGDGYERQRTAIRRYCKRHGIELVGEYRDDGVSGTTELTDRKGLAELLDRIESNGISVVLIERADRLARDLLVSEIILGEFRKAGVKVIEADGGTELTVGDNDPTRNLIRQVLGAVSEFDKSVLVLKLRAARERTRRTHGRCEGRKPFGTHPGEDKTLERIFSLRRKRGGRRLSIAKIADTLNKEGYPTRSGGEWKPGSVHAILKRHGKE